MAATDLLSDLVSKEWQSNGLCTLDIPGFDPYKPGEWRHGLIHENDSYYPPAGVRIRVITEAVPRAEYKVPHNGKDITVPATALKTFSLEVTGTDFDGRDLLNAARFVVMGEHAVSSPMIITMPKGKMKSVVVVVRCQRMDDGKLVMVNELIWSVQYESNQTGSEAFYDIQKWYCCGYP